MFKKLAESVILIHQEKAKLYKEQRLQLIQSQKKSDWYLNIGYIILKTLDEYYSVQKMADEICVSALFDCSTNSRFFYRFDVKLNNLYSFRVNFASVMARDYGITKQYKIKQHGEMLVIEC